MNSRWMKRAAAKCLLAILACGVLTAVVADEPKGAGDTQIAKKFVAHEWGTFSTFSGSDGAYLKFCPNENDLPGFVNSRHNFVKGGLTDAYVSLETPVLYFYSDRDRTVSVHVEFRDGVMTDWYPEASRRPTENIRWDNLQITPGHLNLPEEGGRGRYFHARDADSAFLRTAHNANSNEKFLFYRGVGEGRMPFTVRALGGGEFVVKNTAKDAIPGLFLIRVQNGKVFFKQSGSLSPQAVVGLKESTMASSAEKLGEAVEHLLIQQGLYEKEARAMVKTWSTDWFGDNGTRVLYLIPQTQTADVLPLSIEPKPDQLVRVLVGRHDILTPEREKEIDVLVKRIEGPSNAESQAANHTLDELGRYRSSAQKAASARLKAQASAKTGR